MASDVHIHRNGRDAPVPRIPCHGLRDDGTCMIAGTASLEADSPDGAGSRKVAADGSPRSLLFVLEYFWPQVGGVENLFYQLTRELTRRGHRCTVLTTRTAGSEREEMHDGVRIVRIGPPHRPSRYEFTLRSIPHALALAKDADLIHTSTYNAAIAARIAGMVRRKPVVVTFHEYLGAVWHALPDTPWPAAAAFRLFERLCVGLRFQSYVAVSRATRNALRHAGVPDRKLTAVYNATDLSGWRVDAELADRLRKDFKADGRPLVGYFGRPGVTKGVEVLLEASRRVRATRGARVLLILGAYPPDRRARLVSAAKASLGEDAIVVPSVPYRDLPSYLSVCDVIAIPSLTEGFGFTTLEASHTDTVVVASDVGSIPEVVSGRWLLVPPADPDALAEGIERGIDGHVEESPIRSFPLAAMVEGYLGVYQRLLHGAQLTGVVRT